ncbi:DUF3108 domain-containing protein [Cognatiluteimonas weifangensis]|uniref:DUF3108 domain-containing protein n=1 Tax=Cognatiluteimonas weifangensis TaxID=2303539 RepID=A0A372DS74_9GAMM|nr:DUF3108 domain-containing protein [Luteimonas weifangensis]RFP62425.1 DUF3108 domain-containing protein [Luteimonas weifangensis]
MTLPRFLLLACGLLSGVVLAQSAPPTAAPPTATQSSAASARDAAALPAPDPAPAPALAPFVATYQVFSDGRRLGDASLRLLRLDDRRWRIDLGMAGSGLMRLTGLNVQQSTLFDSDGHHYRPLSQSTLRRVFLSSKRSTGVYDWVAGSARWDGDLKKSRRAPVPLREGDLSGLLIDLAVIRDAAPGRTLHYRFVEGGRAREHTYVVAAQTEGIEVDGLSYDAMRVSRQDGNDQTVVWVARGVPTPIRILQREDGDDGTDLRLVEYKETLQ